MYALKNSCCFLVGGPAAPEPVLRMASFDLIALDWEPPYTWPYTSIQHYTIVVNNSLINWNQTTFPNTSLEFRSTEELETCAVYAFTVYANNGLSDGIPGTAFGGFPIGMCIL